jgi:transposase
MDTSVEPQGSGGRRGRYLRHSLEFKRAVVEQTLKPGASVSRIARERDLNANQVFAWRRQYRAGSLDGVTPALLAVEIVEHPASDRRDAPARHASLLIETARGRLHIEGRADATTLRLVLDQLLR